MDLRTTTRILPKKGLDQVDLNSSDAAVYVYRDEPDSVLALRGGSRLVLLLALKPALEHGGGSRRMRGESAEVRKYVGWTGLNAHFPVCSPRDTAAETPVAPPPQRRSTPRKRLL